MSLVSLDPHSPCFLGERIIIRLVAPLGFGSRPLKEPERFRYMGWAEFGPMLNARYGANGNFFPPSRAGKVLVNLEGYRFRREVSEPSLSGCRLRLD